MTTIDWLENSAEDIQNNGLRGVLNACSEAWWGLRSRGRRLHGLTPNTRQLRARDTTATIRQRYICEYDAIRAFHNEQWLAEDLVDTITPHDQFWDVGANMGVYTLLATLNGARTVAFEPCLRNAATIEHNIQLNDLPRKPTVVPKALADENARSTFVLDERGTPGGGRGSLNTDWQDGPTTSVETIRGETAVHRDGIARPDIMKIDVEGSELDVLRGLGDLLDDVRVVYCELHGIDDTAVRRYLESSGIQITHDTADTGAGVLKAVRPDE